MLLDTLPARSFIGERDLRRQIDRCVSRALIDADYANRLLADPSVVIEDSGCSPQQRKALRSIHATSLLEFALQARTLFWAVESVNVRHALPQAAALSTPTGVA